MRKVLIGTAGVVLLAVLLFILAPRREIAPQAPDPGRFAAGRITRGAELAKIGNCGVCHTRPDGAPFAGGRRIDTPFGAIYATNITPDPDTGIGRWTEAAFLRAMQEGVRRDGAYLYPAFPYDHFTRVAPEDLRALYAFLMTRQPVRAENTPNALRFPFSARPLIGAWRLLYFRGGEIASDPVLTGELNRGAYLVEGLAHCGACHTPRTRLGAERNDHFLSGGEAEGWLAPALIGQSTAPVPWTTAQLLTYLRRGYAPSHGVAAGPMRAVVDDLAGAPEQDVRAIAAYIGAMLSPTGAPRPKAGREGAPIAAAAAIGQREGEGAVIYAGSCALCHEPSGQRFSARGIGLAASTALALPDPRNLAHIILEGITPPAATPSALMPAFADSLTDHQVAALMRYLRSTFTEQPDWSDVDMVVGAVRASRRG
jgi:mono/diheme cytochrome c family protein